MHDEFNYVKNLLNSIKHSFSTEISMFRSRCSFADEFFLCSERIGLEVGTFDHIFSVLFSTEKLAFSKGINSSLISSGKQGITSNF